MARRMIHAKPLTHASPLHKDIFNVLKSSPTDWVVFYQKNVPEPNPWIYVDPPAPGPFNIDFIIYIPKYCSVICLEVKNDLENAMKALEEHYHGGQLSLGKLQITAENVPPLASPDELVRILRNHALTMLPRYITTYDEDDFKNAQKEWDELLSILAEEEIGQRPTTIFRSDLETLRPQLLRLTANQLDILTQVRKKDRGVIYGAAGTGKTILAMELAKELASASEHGEKKKVALLCSNPYLSRRLEKWAETLEGVVAGTPLTLLEKISDLGENYRNILSKYPTLKESLRSEYKAAEWETFIGDMINLLNGEEYFDYLIVDEAQNLYDKVFLELMNALLKGGLANGKWRLFGDFENQNIVDLQFDGDWKKILEESLKSQEVEVEVEDFSYFKLETNCRSTQEIAEAFSIFLDDDDNDLPPPMNGVHGPDFEIKYFQSIQDTPEGGEKLPTLEELMDDLVSDFKKRGFSSEHMVLLFTDDRNELGIDTQSKYDGCELLDIREVKESLTETERTIVTSSSPYNKLRYSNVYDFQGLESELVFLVLSVTEDMMVAGGGVIIPHEGYMERLLYTGMSRAKTMLVIVADKSYEELIEELILWSKKGNLQSSGDSGDVH